jgi:VanZ family protein
VNDDKKATAASNSKDDMPMNDLRMPVAKTRWIDMPANWAAVFFGLSVIWMESTVLMGGGNTSRWLLDVCHALWGQTDTATFEKTHLLLRKVGHFTGYGLLSVLFYRAWHASVDLFWKGSRKGLRLEAAGLAVVCTFVVACLDEWHQSFLEGRVSSFRDVMIDTSGAIVFTTVTMLVLARRFDFRFSE